MKITFKNKKLVTENLSSFGFEQTDGRWIYTTPIVDGQFLMSVTVKDNGTAETKVTDLASGEEYVLHLMESAAGSFIGKVREEYEAVLNAVAAQCFEDEIFQSDDAKKVIAHVRTVYGDELEFLWKKFPDNAIWRRKDNEKWYAALLTVSGRKLGLDSDEMVEIIDLRMKPEDVIKLVDHKTYYPGWHMNKRNWITIILDGSVKLDEICRRIDESYQLAR